ncbi:MAG: hypothetical protein NZL96_01750 [Patescibacteria group bacterium]|nr:hypothetical protein [Patescibacteria group bacterium]
MSDNEINEFLEKIKRLEKENNLDLSSDEDLSLAVMNLISLEEHFFFTYAKTKKEVYLDLLNQIREIRKVLLRRLVKNSEGENWCISKHLLASSMRLIEVGTKYLSNNKREMALDFFNKAYSLYSLFWGINLKMINLVNFKRKEKDEESIIFLDKKEKKEKKISIFEKLGQIVKKAIDCCRE